MRKGTKICFVALVSIGVGAPAIAQQSPFYFPAEGQSQEQQTKDVAECQAWATTQTSFNPAYPPPPPAGYVVPEVETGPDGSLVRGAAKGAAVGAVAGEIFDDKAGKGAAAGAATGALIGGMKRRQKRRGQQAAQEEAIAKNEQEIAAYQQKMDYLYSQFYSATGVCMSGKGYTVG